MPRRSYLQRALTVFLIVSFVALPMAPLFAEESDAAPAVGSDTSQDSTIAPTSGDQGVDPSSELEGESPADPSLVPPAESQDDTTISPDEVTEEADESDSAKPDDQNSTAQSQGSNASGQGAVTQNFFNQSQFKVDKNTGAARVAYPIVIPPGRNNFQPDLTLLYNSQDAEQGSIFGEGWSISIPYIERLNKNGVDTFYATSTQKYFASSIDGELSTTTVSSNYIARTENGAFNKYTLVNNGWVMTDKNGTKFTFGLDATSQQNDPANSANIYRWMLAEVRDTNNNFIAYSYFKDGGQIYPSSTVYTGNGSTPGIFQVDFLRESRIDVTTSSETGFVVQVGYRIGEIDAKVNGTLVRKYGFTYAAGDNGKTSLLKTITATGRDNAGNFISLPPSTFSYQTQITGWVRNAAWDPLLSFTATSSADNGTRVADVNGDGLPDIIQAYRDASSTEYYGAYINNGAGWTVSSTWNPPILFVASNTEKSVRIVDVNGDALPDIIQAHSDGTNSYYASYINNGAGWTATSTWNPPIIFGVNGVDNGTRIVDINADGLPDIVRSFSDNGGTTTFAAYLNTGSGWAVAPTWNPPALFTASSSLDIGTRLSDVNGDGLPDIIQAYDMNGTSHYGAYMNTGFGWSASSSSVWNPPTVFTLNGADAGVRIADVNGDGLPDIITSGNSWINNGAGWTTNSHWNSPIAFTATSSADNGTRVADVNGDGLPDIIQAFTDADGITHNAAYTNNNKFRADLLTGIMYPQGGSSTIGYQSILQITDDLGTVLNSVPYPVYIVSKLITNDGLQTASNVTYVYYGGTYYTSGPFDHQFAGFDVVKETDAEGTVNKTFYHTSKGTDILHGEYQDNVWKIGKPYRIETYDNAGNLYRTIINKWDSYSLGGNAAFVKLATTTEADYDGLSTHADKAESYSYDNATGNQTQRIQWGQVAANDDGSFTDIGADKYVTDSTYSSSTTGVIGKPSITKMTDQNGNKAKEARYYYDSLALGSATVGNLTKQEDWKTGNTYIDTQNTYNNSGLVTQHLDPRGKQSNYAYDAYGLYPATSTNALSQSTGYQYDYATGKTTQTQDPNGTVFQNVYDALGRIVQIKQPDSSATSTQITKTSYAYTDTANAVSVKQSDYLNATTTVDTYTYYDGLGRVIQTRKSAEDFNAYKVADRMYNTVGLLQKESLPYVANGSERTTAASDEALVTTYTYDSLQRIRSVINAIGTTSNVYANWKTTTTDARGNPKDQSVDAYGNLVRVDEHNGGSIYSTTYTYDERANLTRITDALGNIRDFTYDNLGRRLKAQDLHAVGDGAFGTWTYTYDDAGNITKTVDPKNQTVNYTYDSINRVLTENYTGQTGVELSYTYDICAKGIGRLCIVSSADAVTTNTYNALGQVIQEVKTIASSTYTTSYTYDRQGNQLLITNPDNSQTRYTYNAAGLVETVEQKEASAPNFSILIADFDYSPTDQVALQTYANGMAAKNIYDPSKLYRLVSKVTTISGVGMPVNDESQDVAVGVDGNEDSELIDGEDGKDNGDEVMLLPGEPGSLITTSTITKTCTGTVESYTVPSDVISITVTAYGSQGGGSGGGLGGKTMGTFSVASGTTYYANVGCQNGYNGGAEGGYNGNSPSRNGGGKTWFSTTSTLVTSTVLLLAGGGGGQGGGYLGPGGAGGAGGGIDGSQGTNGGGGIYLEGYGGQGASQSNGGSGGGPSLLAGGCGGSAGVFTTGGIGGCGGPNNSGAGGGGGGGYYGGGGGGGGGSQGGGTAGNGGGGGGGSSFISATSLLTNTSTASGINSGNGSVVIVQQHVAFAPLISSLNQYLLNGTTTLSRGSSTVENGVVLGAMINSSGTQNLQFQTEVEPMGKNFTNIPNVTSTVFGAPNHFATTTFFGVSGTAYHWQARVKDALGNYSSWQRFSSSTFTTDFVIKYFQVTTTSTYTGAVGTYTVPAGITKLIVTAYGSQGDKGGGLGGVASGTLLVVPGTTYYFNIGGGQSGYNGGGAPGSPAGPNAGGYGGGMTWFSSTSTFSTSSVFLIAAGGGGGGGIGLISAPFAGGGGGGTTGSTGGSGTIWCGGTCFGPNGGAGGTQISGGSGGPGAGSGSAVQGGNGANGAYCCGNNEYPFAGGGGGGGGGGYYGGGGGQGGVNNGGGSGGAGGGGGSSFIASTSTLTNTSTATGINSGNGSLTIVGLIAPSISLGSIKQYHINGSSVINQGDSTTEGNVIFGAMLNSEATSSVQLQTEVQSAGTNFTDTPNVTSSALVAPGTFATTSFQGSTGTYHWQARVVDPQNNNFSAWKKFGPSATSTDFRLSPLLFTFPKNGTTTANFPSWSLNAKNVTSTSNYRIDVGWGITNPNVATSSVTVSGTQLLSGVSVPKQLSSIDYSDTGAPVAIVAQGSLYDLTSGGAFIATTTVSFNERTIPATATCASDEIQCISYTYDANGNITQIFDASANSVAKTIDYTYDSLNRLISASSSNTQSGQNYSQTFSYNAIGNITNGPAGIYSYGGSDASYANPHAVTSLTPASPAGATIALDAASTSAVKTGVVATSTIVVGSGTNEALAICIAANKSVTSTVTVDGNPATLLGHKVQGSKAVDLYYFLNASSGTHTVASTLSASTNQVIGITSLFGVSQTNPPTEATSLKGGSGVQASSSVSTLINNDWIVDCIGSAATGTVFSGQTSAVQNTAKNPFMGMSYKLVPTAQAVGTGWNLNASAAWALVSGAFKPSTAATTTLPVQNFVYDNNGNLTFSGNATNTWNYRNQLTQWTGVSATSTYTYDYTGQRVKLVEGGITTIFPNKFYNATPGNSKKAKHIFANGIVVATIETVGTSTTTRYTLNDHLGGANLITDTAGAIVETLDYYPYGAIRTDSKAGNYAGEKRKYIGQEYDAGSGLNYLNERYYDANRGQFVSQDPVFWGHQNLGDPQSLNSYSYANDNPIALKDATGRNALTFSEISISLSLIAAALTLILISLNLPTSRGQVSFTQGVVNNVNNTINNIANTLNNAQQRISSTFRGGRSVATNSSDVRISTIPFADGNVDQWTPPFVFADSQASGLSGKAAADAAQELGYTEKVKPGSVGVDTHGKPLFKNPDTGQYISPDRDGHTGGTWKGFDSGGKRIGTFDENLKRIGD